MDVRDALKSQYHAGLKALRISVENCPGGMWDDPGDGLTKFWRVAYHTLFFTDFYLRESAEAFRPWARHRADAHCLGLLHWENNRTPAACEPYAKEDILEYWGVCDGMVDEALRAMDLGRSECGFPWYPMGKLEHQIVSIRHIQHHAALLSGRLRKETGAGVEWIGMVTR